MASIGYLKHHKQVVPRSLACTPMYFLPLG